jgi:ABC-type polysaccharide/polyol phosphate transport system ATPase subunit
LSKDSFALEDVSFEVKRGETLGIIGHNGAGKSTLLKILAGVTPPTSGDVEVRGRIFPMIELNAGIHPELTGRENVRLLGAIMGLSRRDIEAKVPQIEGFCELEDWFDRPVRMYSSGMLARLGFAVALNIEADILLVDEVLAVGDLNFQRKCIEHMAKLQNSAVTILLVTHAVRQAERVCQNGILLEDGRIIKSDTIRQVASQYYQDTVHQGFNRLRDQQLPVIFQDSGEVSLEEIAIRDLHGKPCSTVETGQDVSIYLRYRLKKNIEDLVFHFGFVTSDMLRVTVFNSLDEPFALSKETQGVVECHIKKLPLMPGAYGLFLSITRSNSISLFKGENLVAFEVVDPSFLYTRRNMELIALDVKWDFSLVDNYVGGGFPEYGLRKSELEK